MQRGRSFISHIFIHFGFEKYKAKFKALQPAIQTNKIKIKYISSESTYQNFNELIPSLEHIFSRLGFFWND